MYAPVCLCLQAIRGAVFVQLNFDLDATGIIFVIPRGALLLSTRPGFLIFCLIVITHSLWQCRGNVFVGAPRRAASIRADGAAKATLRVAVAGCGVAYATVRQSCELPNGMRSLRPARSDRSNLMEPMDHDTAWER